MDPIFLAITAAFVCIPIGLRAIKNNSVKAWDRSIKKIAENRDWTYSRAPNQIAGKLTGRQKRMTVFLHLVEKETEGNYVVETHLRVRANLSGWEMCRPVLTSFNLGTFLLADEHNPTTPQVLTGIPDFDKKYEAYGEPRVILARLGRNGRKQIKKLEEAGGMILSGHLSFQDQKINRSYHELNAFINRALFIAEALTPEGTNDEQILLDTVLSGETTMNRRLCLEQIKSPDLLEKAAQALLKENDLDNHIIALIGLHRRAELVDFLINHDEIDPDILNKAMSYIGGSKKQRGEELLLKLIMGSDAHLSSSLDAIQGTEILVPLPRIREIIAHEDDEVRLAGIGLLKAHSAEALPLLVELLDDSNDDIAVAAINALTLIGTLSEVHPIMERSKGITRSSKLKQAAGVTIAAIQERHGVEAKGGLAIVEETQGGEVALSDAEYGQVSLSDQNED